MGQAFKPEYTDFFTLPSNDKEEEKQEPILGVGRGELDTQICLFDLCPSLMRHQHFHHYIFRYHCKGFQF